MRHVRHLLIALAIVCGVAAQGIRITNEGGRQDRWIDVVIPTEIANDLGDVALVDAGTFETLAYRGDRKVGRSGIVYHLRAELAAGESRVAVLAPADPFPKVRPFAHAPSVIDVPDEVVPRLRVYVEDRVIAPKTQLEPVESSAARIVYRVSTKPVEGFILEGWLYTYHDQEVVDFELQVFWSDRNDPDWTRPVQGITVDFGEFPVVDHATRHGWPAPAAVDGRWVQPIRGLGFMGDAQMIPVRGRLLCGTSLKPGSSPDWFGRIRNLVGASSGTVRAVSLDWPGRWLAFGVTADLSNVSGIPELVEAEAKAFTNLMRTPAQLDVQRPESLLHNTGSTGDQRPFGSSNGALAVAAGDPRWIGRALYSAESFLMRPFHHREDDGRRVLASEHPAWRTWSMRSDFRNGSDILGKPRDWPGSVVLRYDGTDDQHRVDNLEVAAYALTGSYQLESALLDAIETDIAQVPGRPGASRATGRLNRTWAHYLTLLDEQASAKLLERMLARLEVNERTWAGRDFAPGTVRVAQVYTDPRVLTDSGHWTGSAVPAWMVWQETLWVQGLYAAWLVSGNERFGLLAAPVAETIVRHGFHQREDGTWQVAAAVRYLGADPIPAERWGQPGWTTDGGSFLSWILPAVKVAEDICGEDVQQRARAILDHYRPNGPVNLRDAEWLAIR
jgi:hypothetical protein